MCTESTSAPLLPHLSHCSADTWIPNPPSFPLNASRDSVVKFRNPPEQEMRCVVHDRVWVFDDILLVCDSVAWWTVA